MAGKNAAVRIALLADASTVRKEIGTLPKAVEAAAGAIEKATKASEAAMSSAAKATAGVTSATTRLQKAQAAEADAAGKVRVAAEKLAETRANSKAKASQIAAAEEALATAQRKAATSAADAKGAQTKLAAAERSVTVTSDAATAAAKRLAATQSNVFDKIPKAAKGAADKTASAWGGLSTGLAGVGVVAGAALVGSFLSALDFQDAKAKFTAQLGFGDADSKKAGKIAGDLYKGAYGDSLGEVNDTLATVFQSGLAKAGDAAESIKGVTEQVLNYAKLTGEEALPATRAVSQMLKTGLAKNATEAFDILTRGQQLGVNKSEDLLDTFNEYGTQFRKIGLDGPTALGLMNQALQAGARDSDTAADALKEFAIRAVDGSKTTVDGFKSLGLSAKGMQEQIAAGGPKAAAGLDTVLDKLRAVKDPAERSRIAVELFGTQAEDLGAALFALDPSTAVQGLGQLDGAAKRAGDTLNNTAKSKLTTFSRTIQQSVVEAIAKYALPTLEKFADWFNGPGKFVIVSWAIEAGQALLTFADQTLGGLSAVIGGVAKFGKVALIAAAGVVAMANPAMAVQMLKNADALGGWADEAQTGIANARTSLQGWNDTLGKANTRVKFEADIADLDAKIAAAKTGLADPKLTKERRAKLTADIAQAEKNKTALVASYNDPALIKTRIAKLAADKSDADAKIKANLAALAKPGLTATKTAKLKAENKQLMDAARAAQAQIDSLKGKTVNIQLNTYKNLIETTIPGGTGVKLPGRASGGSVTSGSSYWVGENGPEILTLGSMSGYITPNHKLSSSAAPSGLAPAATGDTYVYVEIDGQQLQGRITQTIRDTNRQLKRTVKAG